MANTLQAKKRVRRNAAREDINKARRSRIRTFVKKVELAVEAGNADEAKVALKNLQNNIKMQPCHILKPGSVTKMIIGNVMWQLQEEGRLNIKDLISNLNGEDPPMFLYSNFYLLIKLRLSLTVIYIPI